MKRDEVPDSVAGQSAKSIQADRSGQMTGAYQRNSEPGDDEVVILYIWHVVLRNKWMVATVAFASVVLTLIYLWLATPVYRATTQISPVTEEDAGGGLASSLGELGAFSALTGINVSQGSKKNESIATLGSRAFTERYITDEELLPLLSQDGWIKRHWPTLGFNNDLTLENAWELFDRDLRRLSEDRNTGLVTLSIMWSDPVAAARWANGLVQQANNVLREKTISESEKAIGYLREQLRQTSAVELKEVVNRLIEAEMKKIILANITEEYAFKVIDPAVVPEEPFKPDAKVVVSVGLFLGILAGVVAALFSDYVRRRDHDF